MVALLRNWIGFVVFMTSFSGFSQHLLADDSIGATTLLNSGKLKNGFEFVLTKGDLKASEAVIQFVIKTGYLNEANDQYQAAHFLEHILLASPIGSMPSLHEYLRSKGLELGSDYNASTGFSATTFTFNIPVSDGDVCLKTLDYFRFWMEKIMIPNEVFNSERGTILSEARLSKANSESRAYNEFVANTLSGSKLGEIFSQDSMLKIQQLSKHSVEQFYNDWYQPSLACLVIVGDFDGLALDEEIKKRFEVINNVKTKTVRSVVPNLSATQKVFVMVDEGKSDVDIEFLFKQKIGNEPRNDAEKMKLTFRLFNNMQGQRMSVLRGKKHIPSIRVDEAFIAPETEMSALTARLTVPHVDSIRSGVINIWKGLESLRRFGFSEGEFKEAVKALRKELDEELITNNKLASALVGQYLSKQHFTDPNVLKGEVKRYLSEVSVRDINVKIKTWLNRDNYEIAIGVSSLGEREVPAVKDLNTWVRQVKSSNIRQPLFGPSFVKSLASEINLSPDTLRELSLSEDRELGLWQGVLGSGVVVIMRPTPADVSNKVIMRAMQRRCLVTNVKDLAYQHYAVGMMLRSGLGHLDRDQISEVQYQTNTGVYPFTEPHFSGFVGTSPSDQIETMLQLMYLYITSVKRDSHDAKEWIAEQELEMHPVPSIDDSIRMFLSINPTMNGLSLPKVLNSDSIFKAYESTFTKFNNLTLIFTGNFNVKDVSNLVVKYFSGLPLDFCQGVGDSGLYRTDRVKYPKNRVMRSPSIKDAARIELRYVGEFDYNDQNKFIASLTRRIIQHRLFRRLREQEGGTYFVNTSIVLQKYPINVFGLQIGFEASVMDKGKLIAAALEEIDSLREFGPTQDEISLAKEDELEDLEQKEKRSTFWASYLENQVRDTGKFGMLRNYPFLINSVGFREVLFFFQHYLIEENYYQLELAQ